MDHQEKLLRERKVWEKRVLDFDTSTVSVAEFAKTHGFSVHQFYYWKNKFAKPEVTPDLPPFMLALETSDPDFLRLAFSLQSA